MFDLFPVEGSAGGTVTSPPRPDAEIDLAGACLLPTVEGGLWWASERILIVADLHLEKGSTFARRGQMLPPYDTMTTLATLSRMVARLAPRVVVALGDSFHESAATERLRPDDRDGLRSMQCGREWIWVAGNHDPDIGPSVGGDRSASLRIGPLTLVHEPGVGGTDGEIAGHLHPAARVAGRSGSVRRKCFVSDGRRLVMPAIGAYAGGLSVLSAPFAGLFAAPFRAFLLGTNAVYPVDMSRLRPD